MKVFLDTEFIDVVEEQKLILISIGLVKETGESYYAVSSEYDEKYLDEWLRNNVISKLGDSEIESITRFQNEKLAKIKEFQDAGIKTEQEAADLRVKVNEDAARQIEEINKKQNLAFVNQVVFATSTVAGLIGQTAETYAMFTQNRLTELDNEQTKEIESIDTRFEARQAEIEALDIKYLSLTH